MASKRTLQRKYETACTIADQLYQKLQAHEQTLLKGKVLVDQLMGVAEENERLKTRIVTLEAIIEGTEPPESIEMKA